MPCFPFFSNAGFPRFFLLNGVRGDECERLLRGEDVGGSILPCIYCLDSENALLDTLLCRTEDVGICVYKVGVSPGVLPVIIQGKHIPGSLAKRPGAGQFERVHSAPPDKVSNSRINVAIYSLEDGSLEKLIPLPEDTVSVDSCVLPPDAEPIVGVVRGNPLGPEATADFVQAGKTLVAGTRGLSGVTPDLRFMFYVAREGAHLSSRSCTLWRLETGTGHKKLVLKEVHALRIRCSRDNKRFGLLKGEWEEDALAISGYAVYDLEGTLLSRLTLPEPVMILDFPKDARGYTPFDWDLDGEQLVYWDKKADMIVIKKFNGTVVASFAP